MNYSTLTLSCLFTFCFHLGHSQQGEAPGLPLLTDSLALKYATSISEADLKNYLSILASDALEGRETGTRGQKMAAAFIREHFRDNNLLPIVRNGSDSLFFQKFSLYRNYYKEISIENNGTKYTHLEDMLYVGNAELSTPVKMDLQFVGNGEESDYQGLDVKNSMVAFFAETPDQRQVKMKVARGQGAIAFFIVNSKNKSEFEQYLDQNESYLNSTSITWEKESPGKNAVFFGYPELLAELLTIDTSKIIRAMERANSASKNPFRKLKPVTLTVKIEKVSEQFETENVLGFIEGSDSKEELVVITAHYDHEGKKGDQIYNGADDDGSGTSALMEMAQAFSIAKSKGNGPRRSLLFMTVTGEEKGLLGSDYYSKNPAWPLNKTIANLNIDMIGRVDPEHKNNEQYVYIIGSDHLSMELHQINLAVNQLYTQLELDYKYNSPDDPNRFYYRSDHYNFAKHNIPIIFYFNGTHEDYHKPTDTIEKIRFDLLKKRTDLVFHCAWELANRKDRIQLEP